MLSTAFDRFRVSNPANGENLCRYVRECIVSHVKDICLYSVTCASEELVKAAIDNAQTVFESGVWSRSPAIHRSKILSKLARKLEESIPELARIETLQTGRTIREMNAQLSRLPEWL